MGKFSDKKKADQQDVLLNGVTDNDKIESLKEVLNLLSATNDGTTKLQDIISDAVTEALTAATGETGLLTQWADARYAPVSNG
jgi:hypothetical protein